MRRKFWPNSTRAVLEFWCFAEKALHDDKRGTPGRLFYTLVKAKDTRFVLDAQEQRAMARIGSHERQDLVDRAGGLNGLPAPLSEDTQYALFGDTPKIGYHHGIMMQCFLPQKQVAKRRHIAVHGRASLVIESGILANPEKPHEYIECGLPYGSRARLIIPYINSYAVIRKTREIDLGQSLRRFMEKIGSPITGYNGKKVTEQIQSLAAAQFTLGEWSEDSATTKYGRFAEEVSFWIERDPEQQVLWTPTMSLSQRYYDALRDRHVPIDMNHLVKLTRSERRMDLYSWLSYRLPALHKGKVLRVSLRDLQPIFAPDIRSPKRFKQKLGEDLEAIARIYPGFRVEITGDLVTLEKSAPPIPRKIAYVV